MTAEMFAPYRSRFAPVAIIAARTPQQAIAELDYAVRELGYRAIMLRGNQERPIPAAAAGIDAQKAAWYCDNIALDSPYDYEPFWRRCEELRVAVTEIAVELVEADDLGRANEGEILRPGEDDEPFAVIAFVRHRRESGLHIGAGDGGQREGGELVSNTQHLISSLLMGWGHEERCGGAGDRSTG